jgi:hypothetical protein
MSWRLILQLWLFGLTMAIVTVYFIPSNIESPFWLAIIVACALLVARRAPGKFFLHGFLVGLANWVSVTGAHVILFDAYIARHAKEVAALQAMPVPASPRVMMSISGPIVGMMRRFGVPVPGASGIVIGSLAWMASKIVARKTSTP